MKTKELKIKVPKGYEIDKDNSTFECIKFKPLSLTYEDVARKLFHRKSGYYISSSGRIGDISSFNYATENSNNATSKKQLQKLLAINKLMNVAKYLNGDWQPDWDDASQNKYCICIGCLTKDINISIAYTTSAELVYFKSKEVGQQAIDILGKDTIMIALSTDW